MVSTKGRFGIALAVILVVVVAVIILYPHQVDVSSQGNGSVEPSGETDIRFYEDLTIDILPDDGYTSEVYVDGVLKAEDVTSFTYSTTAFDFGSHSVKVVFREKTPVKERYTLTVEKTGDGSVFSAIVISSSDYIYRYNGRYYAWKRVKTVRAY